MSRDDFGRISEVQQMVARMGLRQYKVMMDKAAHATTIKLADEPEMDEYGTVTLGTWKGYLIQVMPMLFNDRLVMSPVIAPYTYDHGWCFDKGGAAYLAALVWDPETQGEPPGYKKCATGGKRKPGEDVDTDWPVGVRRVTALIQILES